MEGPGQCPWGQAVRQKRDEAAMGGCGTVEKHQAWTSCTVWHWLVSEGTAQAEPPCVEDDVPSAVSLWE